MLGVASEAALFALEQRPVGGVIDLSPNTPPALVRDPDLAVALAAIDAHEAARLLHYPTTADTLVHRRTAASWLGRRGVEAPPDSIVICAGAQHAMDTAISVFPEIEEIACEALVYPGLKAVARRWRRRLHAMAMDREGVIPEAFEAACRAGVRLAVLSPTLHNPTTATMSADRRRQVVEIARRWDVILVEEDVYGLLPENAPSPLAALAPERVLYLTGLSKTVAPGLRIGYLVFPPRLHDRMRDTSHHTTWYVSPLSAALASRWLGDGTAWRRLLAQRRELAARHRCRRVSFPPDACLQRTVFVSPSAPPRTAPVSRRGFLAWQRSSDTPFLREVERGACRSGLLAATGQARVAGRTERQLRNEPAMMSAQPSARVRLGSTRR